MHSTPENTSRLQTAETNRYHTVEQQSGNRNYIDTIFNKVKKIAYSITKWKYMSPFLQIDEIFENEESSQQLETNNLDTSNKSLSTKLYLELMILTVLSIWIGATSLLLSRFHTSSFGVQLKVISLSTYMIYAISFASVILFGFRYLRYSNNPPMPISECMIQNCQNCLNSYSENESNDILVTIFSLFTFLSLIYFYILWPSFVNDTLPIYQSSFITIVFYSFLFIFSTLIMVIYIVDILFVHPIDIIKR
ncbi:hypothetical protein TBLA_0H00510 [Henningerozyma blattae CBS 6284]|uniref:Uncharacterized protein n=1 Tax=Henningerozyma blattae (strain ATCC 34711 / CBS 6284 / DSM 70876 / NBRC 10599 / NRRL Y-10934 / UCD 77-7) TaxID=1071380 RepID=I2H7J1_HENB6|nr:hypothetical protein TBLA_0H00510 [Tetrapisispora blattae CBS 6284]CCH62343.1 hypothetical protein TBLA_0H00510 [Tetrapisispora blattae CBS 6284]